MKLQMTFEWLEKELMAAMGINLTSFEKLMRNGRFQNFLLTAKLQSELITSPLNTYNAPSTLIDLNGGRWPVRAMTQTSGVSFSPNSMKGKGRCFEANKFNTYIEEQAGFFVGDTSLFPTVPVFSIKKSEIQKLYQDNSLIDGHMSRSNFLALSVPKKVTS